MLNTESWYFQQQHFSQERCITLKRCLLMILASRSKSSKHLGIHDDGRGGSVHFTILDLQFTICTWSFTFHNSWVVIFNLQFYKTLERQQWQFTVSKWNMVKRRDAIAISKSETINHSLTDWPTDRGNC